MARANAMVKVGIMVIGQGLISHMSLGHQLHLWTTPIQWLAALSRKTLYLWLGAKCKYMNLPLSDPELLYSSLRLGKAESWKSTVSFRQTEASVEGWTLHLKLLEKWNQRGCSTYATTFGKQKTEWEEKTSLMLMLRLMMEKKVVVRSRSHITSAADCSFLIPEFKIDDKGVIAVRWLPEVFWKP